MLCKYKNFQNVIVSIVGHHELYGEPQSSKVSNIHSSTEVTGKAIELSAEGQTDKVTVEESRSISKILQWFGRGSRDGKLKESPVKREMNEEEPKKSPEARSEDSSSPVDQPMTKPPPKPRRGLFELFSRAEKKDKIPEVQASDKEVISRAKIESLEREPSCTLRPESDDNILQQTPVPTESRMAEILKDKNKPDRLICEDTPPREKFDQGEVSPGKMANLKSFWERGDRGPKILSIKKEPEVEESETSQLSENYHNALDRRLSDSNTSPSKPKPSDPNPVDVESTTSEISSVSPRRSSCGIDTSAISSREDGNPSSLDGNKVSEGSSSELQTLTVKINVKLSPSSLLKYKDNSLASDLQEELICRDISHLKKEISTFKMSLSQQEDKVSINDLKSFWEKEKSGLKIIVGSPTCTANVKDPYTESSPKRSSVGLSEPQFDIRSNSPSSLDRMSFNEVGLIAQNEKMEKTEEKQRSPIRMPLQDLQDIRGRASYVTTNISNFKQSVSDKHSKPSPPSSPLRSLPPKGQHDKPQSADIYQPKDQDQTRTSSPLRQSKVPRRDSYPNKESKKDGSPLRTFAIDINPGDRSSCDVRVKSGQTRSRTSPEHQGKTPEGRSDDRPNILKERKLSADSLTRFYIPLSLHHYLGVPEQMVLDEREQVKVQAYGTFEQVNQGIVSNESSPSRHSLPESEEITFDSSGSSTPEAWSISHTSSYCELTSPFWFSLVSVERR